ncbi:MAG: RPA family protein, partial [Halobacterium sp.]
MSQSGEDEVNRREVAYRLFAAEFEDADYSYAESDEERAPNYVVTPTGARVNRLFVVGVLTEVEQVSEDVVRARVVDPTGAFVIYAGQYQPEALAALESAETPSFVAVTGKARTFQPEDSDVVYTSIRPEEVTEVDADTRDRWVVSTAEQTVDRVATMAAAHERVERGDNLEAVLREAGVQPGLAAGIPLALDHYGTSAAYLDAVRDLALDAARVVAGELNEAGELSLSPSDGGDESLDFAADLNVDADVAASAGDDESATATDEETVTEAADSGQQT